jgi:hypothetical protein
MKSIAPTLWDASSARLAQGVLRLPHGRYGFIGIVRHLAAAKIASVGCFLKLVVWNRTRGIATLGTDVKEPLGAVAQQERKDSTPDPKAIQPRLRTPPLPAQFNVDEPRSDGHDEKERRYDPQDCDGFELYHTLSLDFLTILQFIVLEIRARRATRCAFPLPFLAHCWWRIHSQKGCLQVARKNGGR